jgi:hypothetical protein
VIIEKLDKHPAQTNYFMRVPLISIMVNTSEKETRGCLLKEKFLMIDWRIRTIFQNKVLAVFQRLKYGTVF